MTGRSVPARWWWSPEQIESVGSAVTVLLRDYLTALPGRPVFGPVPDELKRAWSAEPAPEAGRAVGEILERFAAEIAPYPFGNGHPRFYGWVNAPPQPLGIFAEALAAAMNPSVAGGDHAATHIERQILRWFADRAGLPGGAGGLLTSGGSTATLTALAAARHAAAARAGVDVRAAGVQGAGVRFLLYASSEAHSCVRKAAELLGLGSDNIRTVPADEAFRLRPGDLDRMLVADQSSGHVPVAVVASAGTVNSGAIDPLGEIARVCAARDVWLHVDGAYGGPAILLLDDYADARRAFRHADSIAIDPHKWLYIPVDAGMILFRDPARARDAFSLVPPYLRADGDSSGVWFSELGFDQTRPFRALKILMALQHLGLDGYRDLIRHDLQLAAHLRNLVNSSADLELLASGLSVTCLRYRPDGWSGSPGQLDDLNTRIVSAIQRRGDAFITGTTVAGQAALRACIINPGTVSDDMDLLVDQILTHGSRLRPRHSPPGA
jgi:glutamate/tyrosine decarboxylase-like PLP-dependent enzyme